MKLKRDHTIIRKINDTECDDEYVDATCSERILMVWNITKELWSITEKGAECAEQRLQRDVVHIRRI